MKDEKYKKFAKYYDAIYNRVFYNDYANFVKMIIDEYLFSRVKLLDVACGTGLFINEVRKKIPNSVVSGFDSSLSMLLIAKKRNKGVIFYNQSFCDFYIKEKFNVIVSTFDSINYILSQSELSVFLKNISEHLTDDGLFIFDFNTKFKNPPQEIRLNNVAMINEIKGKFWHIKISIKDKNKIYNEKHTERLYSKKEMYEALKHNGFRNVIFYSDLKGTAEIYNASRLFVVAKKREGSSPSSK
ncbi:class I SAM-dependent methyltransferase [Candidatus Kuenenbacteria bacterium]|nr:class I SAM-dependent methyltransferase [Candidatus Kuenenbacteria bacterium]